jgi:hypothetical protein
VKQKRNYFPGAPSCTRTTGLRSVWPWRAGGAGGPVAKRRRSGADIPRQAPPRSDVRVARHTGACSPASCPPARRSHGPLLTRPVGRVGGWGSGGSRDAMHLLLPVRTRSPAVGPESGTGHVCARWPRRRPGDRAGSGRYRAVTRAPMAGHTIRSYVTSAWPKSVDTSSVVESVDTLCERGTCHRDLPHRRDPQAPALVRPLFCRAAPPLSVVLLAVVLRTLYALSMIVRPGNFPVPFTMSPPPSRYVYRREGRVASTPGAHHTGGVDS